MAGSVPGRRSRVTVSRGVRTVLAVKARYTELHGGELASAVTLAAFLSLLPLLLVGIAVLGFVSANSSTDLTAEVIDQLGIGKTSELAEQLTTAINTAEQSRKAASVVGLAGLLWTGLGVVRALQYTWDSAWQVRGRGIKDRFVGIAWLGGAGVLFVGSFTLSAAGQWLPWFLAPLGIVAGLGTGVALWLWTSKVLPNRDVGWRPLLPAAVVGAVGFEVLKIVGSYWVPHAVGSSSAVYGGLGVVFALLAWLLVFGRLVALTAVVEVVLWEQNHGTVSVDLEVPARPGVVPLAATRAGQQRTGEPKRPGLGIRARPRRTPAENLATAPDGPGVSVRTEPELSAPG